MVRLMIRILAGIVLSLSVFAAPSMAATVRIDLSLDVGNTWGGDPLFGVSTPQTINMSFWVETVDADIVAAGDLLGGRTRAYDLYRFGSADVLFSSVTYGTQTWTGSHLQNAGFGGATITDNVLVLAGGLAPQGIQSASFRLVDGSNSMDWAMCASVNASGIATISECGSVSDGTQAAIVVRDGISLSVAPLTSSILLVLTGLVGLG